MNTRTYLSVMALLLLVLVVFAVPIASAQSSSVSSVSIQTSGVPTGYISVNGTTTTTPYTFTTPANSWVSLVGYANLNSTNEQLIRSALAHYGVVVSDSIMMTAGQNYNLIAVSSTGSTSTETVSLTYALAPPWYYTNVVSIQTVGLPAGFGYVVVNGTQKSTPYNFSFIATYQWGLQSSNESRILNDLSFFGITVPTSTSVNGVQYPLIGATATPVAGNGQFVEKIVLVYGTFQTATTPPSGQTIPITTSGSQTGTQPSTINPTLVALLIAVAVAIPLVLAIRFVRKSVKAQ